MSAPRWFAHWRDLADNILPRRGSFLGPAHRAGRGDKRNGKLLDFHRHAGRAHARVRPDERPHLAGAAVVPPRHRQPALSEMPEVRLWLDDVRSRMFRVFARSNLYNALAVAYEELGVFGTAALVVMEDDEEIVRAYPLTAGEYWLGASERQTVNTLYRTLGMTTLPARRALWPRRRLDAGARALRSRRLGPRGRGGPCHRAQRRGARAWQPAARQLGNRNMPFRSVWYEKSGAGDAVLDVGGFEEFPALCPRWHLIGNDVYGRSPGMDALPDAKSLQLMQHPLRRDARQDGEPAHGGARRRCAAGSRLDAGRASPTWPIRTGVGFKSAYQINPPLDQLSAAIERPPAGGARRLLCRPVPDGDASSTTCAPPPRSPSAATRSW